MGTPKVANLLWLLLVPLSQACAFEDFPESTATSGGWGEHDYYLYFSDVQDNPLPNTSLQLVMHHEPQSDDDATVWLVSGSTDAAGYFWLRSPPWSELTIYVRAPDDRFAPGFERAEFTGITLFPPQWSETANFTITAPIPGPEYVQLVDATFGNYRWDQHAPQRIISGALELQIDSDPQAAQLAGALRHRDGSTSTFDQAPLLGARTITGQMGNVHDGFGVHIQGTVQTNIQIQATLVTAFRTTIDEGTLCETLAYAPQFSSYQQWHELADSSTSSLRGAIAYVLSVALLGVAVLMLAKRRMHE